MSEPSAAASQVERLVGPFVISIGSSQICWFVEDLEGDPGRTLVLTTATRYETRHQAEAKLLIARERCYGKRRMLRVHGMLEPCPCLDGEGYVSHDVIGDRCIRCGGSW